jgi:hypothetical protein
MFSLFRRAAAFRRGATRRLLVVAAFFALVFPLTALSLSHAATTAGPDQIGQWGPIVNWPTMGKHLALLPTNEVLAFSTGANAHVWDLATGNFTAAPFAPGDLHCAGHALLPDGRLIVIGGVNVTPQIGIKINAIFDPWSNTWANKTPMKYARWYPTATILPDGRLLATSGTNESKVKVPIPEIYDVATDTWTELPGANREIGRAHV